MPQRHIWQTFLGWFKAERAEGSAREGGFAVASATIDEFDTGRMRCADSMEEPVSDAELQEFLAADFEPTPADPEFREQLREQLWALVQDGVTAHPKDH